ncbi:MAG: hypothetical protein ACRDIY_24030 [Chloroflexota bacterium]
MDEILERVVRQSGVVELLDVLVERLAPTDLQSLLIEVNRRRAARQAPADLLDQYRRNRFVQPSPTDPRAFLELDRLAFSLAAPPFQPIELSPLAPLGATSVLTTVSQNVAVATARNVEVVSDSTNVLALECARRRRTRSRTRSGASDRVRLCASHRLLRAQRFAGPKQLAHFRAFALCTAGRDEGNERFELESLAEQLEFYLRFLAAGQSVGFPMSQPRIAVTDLTGRLPTARLQPAVLDPLATRFPDARLGFDPERASGRGYYETLCFKVYATDPRGVEHELADGGFTDWTRTLLSDRKERLLISGIGTERIRGVFGGEE